MKPKGGSLRKPAFCLNVRRGLLYIMRRVNPSCEIEARAIRWAEEYCDYAQRIRVVRKKRANASGH
jgi:hypothetical protein